jgi:hypothetical protein
MALAFDKSNAYDTGMTVASLGLTQSATVGFWAKRASAEIRSPIGNNPSQPDRDVFTFFYVDGPWARINTSSRSNVTINAGTWTTDWTHLLATYDGSVFKLYVNGSYVSQQTNIIDNLSSDASNWWIGKRGNQPFNWWGDIAEFAMWDVVLTDSEIASLGKGFSNSKVRPQNLLTNSRLIRTLADVKGRSTASGSVTASSHPRVYA